LRGLRITWDDKMLNKSALTDDSVSNMIDMMIWLSAQYGPPVKQAVPKILNPDLALHERCWGDEDPRTVFAWADAEVAYLSELCNMKDWSVQVAPNGNEAQLHRNAYRPADTDMPPETDKLTSLTPLKSNAWDKGKYPGYFVDHFGRPTFFYDPRRCVEPGYFTKTMLPQFATLKIFSNHPPSEFGEDSLEQLTQMTACHMGFGFTLLALAQSPSSSNWASIAMLGKGQADEDELPYLYGTFITLAAHCLTREQVLATYGQLMAQRTRKILTAAYEQIHAQTSVLKLLKMISRPIHTERPERSHLGLVQASGGPE